MIIEGFVAPGFESVRTLYRERMRKLVEANTQLCVYVEGQCVVDLWGSAIDDKDYSPDAITNVFSSSKNLESIALAWLFDQGLMSYQKPIAEYWPEFTAHGKSEITVADLMRHEAGLSNFSKTLNKSDLLPENIKENSIGKVIEEASQHFRLENSPREYHAITRGWISNELFRRIDPAGRTIGEFVRQMVAEPLGADVYLGLTDAEHARIAKISSPSVFYQLVQSFIPKSLGRRTDLSMLQLINKFYHMRSMLKGRSNLPRALPIQALNLGEFWYDRRITRGEIPSANANASARGLARLAAALANRGELDGSRIFSETAWQAMHAEPIRADMGFITTFTQGGVAQFAEPGQAAGLLERGLNQGRGGFYGWMGAGGSIFQWHPEHKIGFGYVPTSMNYIDFVNERGKAYQTEVLRCVTRR